MAICKNDKANRWYISRKIKQKDGSFRTLNIRLDERGNPWLIRGEGRVSRSYMEAIEEQEVNRVLSLTGHPTIGNAGTIGALISSFLANERESMTSDSTIENYQYALRNYLLPIVPADTLVEDAFTMDNLDAIKALVYEKNKAPSSINNKYTAIKKLAKFARERKKISSETLEDIMTILKSVHGKDAPHRNYLRNPKEDAQALFATFDKQDGEYKMMFLTMFYCALRVGELQGLKVKDFNFEESSISVERQVNSHGKEIPHTKNGVLGSVHIPSSHAQALKEYIAERCLNQEDYLFQNEHGRPISRHKIRYLLDRHLEMAKLPHITLHGLRHTFATWLFESGFDVKQVQMQLRHDSMDTTMDYYIHLTQGQRDRAFDKMDLATK